MCVLRERGEHDQAEQLRRGVLAEQMALASAEGASDAAIAARLDTILEREADRVATAALVAEFLQVPSAAPVAVAPPVPARPAPARTPVLPAAPAPAPAPARAGVSIADFIDAMIAQETVPPSANAARRS